MDQPKDQQQPASPSQGGQIQVKISDETLKGVYANMVQVGHGPEEFVLDFMNLFPPSGIVSARVILSPGHMKRVIATMQENLKLYEGKFGAIKLADQAEHKIGFRTE